MEKPDYKSTRGWRPLGHSWAPSGDLVAVGPNPQLQAKSATEKAGQMPIATAIGS
jgi:hypothetical protein